MAPSTPEPNESRSPSELSPAPVQKIKRTRKPTQKAREQQEQTNPFEIGNGSQRQMDVNATEVIIALKELVEQQSATIEELREDLQEIKTEQHDLKKQNEELKGEVLKIQTRLETLSVSPPRTRSWASIADGQSATGSSSNITQATSRESVKEAMSIRISTHPTSEDANEDGEATETLKRYLPTDTANTLIRNALQNNEATKEVQIAGIGTTKTGYVIRFRDEKSTQTARSCTEWLEALGNGTKFIRPRFGVVVHRTPTENITLPEDQTEVIKNIMEENSLESRGYQIAEVAWLKKKDKPLGHTASLGVWFDSKEAAEWAINNGLVFGQRFIGSIEPCQVKKKRCHRCLRVGHLAWSCKEEARCGHCAGNHEQRECPPGTAAKCFDCSRAHPIGDRECEQDASTQQ
jgi:hypothetical protein